MNRQIIIYVALGIAGVAALVLYFLFAYAPLAKKLAEKKRVLTTAEINYTQEQDLISRRDEFDERATRLRLEKIRLDQELPTTDRMPELLKAITLAATSEKLKQINFQPLSLTKKDGYSEQRIQLSAICRYHALGAFISKISEMPRLVNVEVVEIKQRDETGKSESITATLMLVTYVRDK